MTCNLADLRPGDAGTILELAAVGAGRLAEMGLTAGQTVEVLAEAPLGDPIEIRIRGYKLTLRRAQARLVAVARTVK